jgi:hypothetical protein
MFKSSFVHWLIMGFLGGMTVQAIRHGAYAPAFLIIGGMLAEGVLYHVQIDRSKP